MTFQFILSCLYFFLPAYFVNIVPPLIKESRFFQFLDKPIDFNKNFLGKPILGSHKSWRGAIFGIIIGFLIIFSQKLFYQFSAIQKISFLDYQRINIYLFAFLMSFGAVFGDLLFAFIKRRLGLEPGASFLPFDQINYVIGAFLFLQLFLKFNFMAWFTLLVLTFFLHIVGNYLGYSLGLHKAKW